MHCSQTAEYVRCVEDINCTSDSEQYQYYLRIVGAAAGFGYICEASVLPGLLMTNALRI